jgi:hypothetical protein
MFYNAFFAAVIIARIAICSNRAVQVVFSNKAIVSVIGGQVRFQVRVYDVDSQHPVVEAHVRLYAVTKERAVPRPMRIIQPNDELNAMLFLSLPQVVSHHIDLYSMLHPHQPDHPLLDKNQGLMLRQADSATCSREEVTCAVCGESYGTHGRLINHTQYQQRLEKKYNVPAQGTHLATRQQELELDRFKPSKNLQVLKAHFEVEISEVICVVEGIDPLTSGTFTALYSYRAEDIVWDNGAMFHPCIRVDSDIFRVDLDRFHQIDSKPDGRQQQMSIRLHDSFFLDDEHRVAKGIEIPPCIPEGDEEPV